MSWWRGLVASWSDLFGDWLVKPGAGQGSPLRVAPLYRAILVNSYIRPGLVTYTTMAASLRPPTLMPCNTSGPGWRGSGGCGCSISARRRCFPWAIVLALGWRHRLRTFLRSGAREADGLTGWGGAAVNHSTGTHPTTHCGTDF